MSKVLLKVLAIFLISIFLFTANVMASGYIIIDSIAGIEIFIDDQFVGVTEEGDMIIEKAAVCCFLVRYERKAP